VADTELDRIGVGLLAQLAGVFRQLRIEVFASGFNQRGVLPQFDLVEGLL